MSDAPQHFEQPSREHASSQRRDLPAIALPEQPFRPGALVPLPDEVSTARPSRPMRNPMPQLHRAVSEAASMRTSAPSPVVVAAAAVDATAQDGHAGSAGIEQAMPVDAAATEDAVEEVSTITTDVLVGIFDGHDVAAIAAAAQQQDASLAFPGGTTQQLAVMPIDAVAIQQLSMASMPHHAQAVVGGGPAVAGGGPAVAEPAADVPVAVADRPTYAPWKDVKPHARRVREVPMQPHPMQPHPAASMPGAAAVLPAPPASPPVLEGIVLPGGQLPGAVALAPVPVHVVPNVAPQAVMAPHAVSAAEQSAAWRPRGTGRLGRLMWMFIVPAISGISIGLLLMQQLDA